MCILVYKYGFSLAEACNLTIPQIDILKRQLSNILRMENGSSDVPKKTSAEINTMAMTNVAKELHKITGRSKYSFAELQNPQDVVRRHKQKQGHAEKAKK